MVVILFPHNVGTSMGLNYHAFAEISFNIQLSSNCLLALQSFIHRDIGQSRCESTEKRMLLTTCAKVRL